MANKWLVHIKKTMKKMKASGTYKKGMGLKQVILAAKKTWHKAKKGGGDSDEESHTEKAVNASGDFETVSLEGSSASTGTTGTETGASDVAGGKRRRKTRRRRSSRRR
uniref:Uncharacterized protein n=1 Tax=viral metagenome TaxID=1070528 RepID=A0A6C0JKM7_9ZZZZ